MSEIKIVSGGQTGVDQGALEAAVDLGLDYGGWAPWRWLAEAPLGAIPACYRAKVFRAGVECCGSKGIEIARHPGKSA